MNSMTGYAFLEAEADGTHISVELKSVNSRFLDLSVNIPPFLSPLEMRLRAAVSGKILRGKADLSVRVRDASPRTSVTADPQAAVSYRDAIRDVARALGKPEDDIPLSLILSQEGVLNVSREYDAEAYWQKIEPVLADVLSQFLADRSREGGNLRADLLEKLSVLEECAAFFREWQPKMEAKFREQVSSKFRELLADSADENRIMAETAAMIVRYTINEEIVRLQSHLSALRAELEESPAPGRKIDFICQEINREINTIGSKNQFTEVGEKVIAAKDALENIREQARNIE